MEIKTILTFQTICKLSSFSKAAVELGYSQSAVTMQIKQLEGELNVKLFDRIGKTIQITNEGYRFLKYANEIITSAQNAVDDLSSGIGLVGVLRIGILESVCTAYLPQILNVYHNCYPQISTVIQIGTFDELSPMLNSNYIDLLWTFDRELDLPEWKKAFSYRNKIEIVCAVNHPLSRADKVTLSDLDGETFILTEKNCSYRRIFEENLLASGICPNIFIEVGNTEMIKKFVEANLGITVLPQFTLIEELAEKKLQIVNATDFQLQMHGQVFYHKNKWLSPAMETFINLVSECSYT